ncbi:MAG: hypothetical protein MK105_12435 [Crocinitomicaceae bacterium]|nr:hypothetical protein [Crocinitomicaceae bacterium]
MKSFILSNNKHFKTEDDLIKSIAESTVASFKLEGIELDSKETLELVRESVLKFKRKNNRSMPWSE